MRIAYVAKHNSGGNDDEGAIHHVLTSLKHEVYRIREDRFQPEHIPICNEYDFVLFHHWRDYTSLRKIRAPKVFWYFDLVDAEDPSLRRRSIQRRLWIERMTQICDLGFCTDGDWAARGTGKLELLRQGMDERVACLPAPLPDQRIPILFTGITKGGARRMAFVQAMEERYRQGFVQYTSGRYRHSLAELYTEAKIVVAPDYPITDKYWSNRIYNALGMGAFLLHPYAEGLNSEFILGTELVTYRTMDELHQLIEHYMANPRERLIHAQLGAERVLNQHLYRHRVMEMLAILKKRGVIHV